MENLTLSLEFDINDDNEKELLIKVYDSESKVVSVSTLTDLFNEYLDATFDENDIEDADQINEEIVPELEDVTSVLEEMTEQVNTTISSANELAANLD